MFPGFLLAYLPACFLLNGVFLIALFRDCWQNRSSLKEEPGNPVVLALYCMAVQFLSAFGVSDFAIHMVVWRKFKWVPDRKLPGTMLSACIIPQMLMGIAYITTISVEFVTLILSLACSILGAFFGVRIVTKLSEEVITRMICAALLLSSLLMILGLLDLMPLGGTETGLRSWRLVLHCVVTVILSALSMAGFPVTALKMSLTSSIGLSTKAAYPLASGSAALTIPLGGLEFIKHDAYCRKMTLISTVTGSLGALIAVTMVKNMNLTLLQWGVAILAMYSGLSMVKEMFARTQKADSKT